VAWALVAPFHWIAEGRTEAIPGIHGVARSRSPANLELTPQHHDEVLPEQKRQRNGSAPPRRLPSSSRTASLGAAQSSNGSLAASGRREWPLGKRLALLPRHLLHVLDRLGRRHVISLCRCLHLAPADIPIIPMLVFGDAASAVCTHRHSSRCRPPASFQSRLPSLQGLPTNFRDTRNGTRPKQSGRSSVSVIHARDATREREAPGRVPPHVRRLPERGCPIQPIMWMTASSRPSRRSAMVRCPRITFLVRTPRTAIHTLDCGTRLVVGPGLHLHACRRLGRLLSRMSRRGWGRAPLRRRPRHDEEVSLGAAQDAFALKTEGDRDLP
jgi:hypothetical protein